MIAVIFEVWPAEGARAAYLDIAARLRPSWSAWTASSRWSGSRA